MKSLAPREDALCVFVIQYSNRPMVRKKILSNKSSIIALQSMSATKNSPVLRMGSAFLLHTTTCVYMSTKVALVIESFSPLVGPTLWYNTTHATD